MNNFLDISTTRQQLDPSGILDTAELFFQQCSHAEELARECNIPKLRKFDNVVICGMGGSAIGGDLIRSYASAESPVPIEVVRNYTLPQYVGKKTLVITGSYSGNTEETLSCYREARVREAQIVAITTGGSLGRLCSRDGYPSLRIPAGYAPRTALGYSIMPLLVLFERWGLLPDQSVAIKNMYKVLKQTINANCFEVPTSSNPAKQLAISLHGSIPVIYAGQDAFEPVAVRWRAQFNENTKSFAHNFVVPEMNHNEILGWSHPTAGVCKLSIVFLLDKGYHKQIKKRFKVMKTIFDSHEKTITEVESDGNGLLARMVSLISLGDFATTYLAYLYKQDPMPIPEIDMLKHELAK